MTSIWIIFTWKPLSGDCQSNGSPSNRWAVDRNTPAKVTCKFFFSQKFLLLLETKNSKKLLFVRISWSYGILLYELVTMGGTPYPSVPVECLLNYLDAGNRMQKPTNCSQELYAHLISWQDNPSVNTFSHSKLSVFFGRRWAATIWCARAGNANQVNGQHSWKSHRQWMTFWRAIHQTESFKSTRLIRLMCTLIKVVPSKTSTQPPYSCTVYRVDSNVPVNFLQEWRTEDDSFVRCILSKSILSSMQLDERYTNNPISIRKINQMKCKIICVRSFV